MSTKNIHPIFDQLVSKEERERFLNQRACVFWMTGLSGSGKSTIAKGVERNLFNLGYLVQVLDGDNVRQGISNNLGFSLQERQENIRRIAEISKLYITSGVVVICSFISPTFSIRKIARDIIGESNFYEIFVNASLKECELRDVKGLYAKARKGLIKGFTGIDSPYENPVNPDLEILTGIKSVDQSVVETSRFISDQINLK